MKTYQRAERVTGLRAIFRFTPGARAKAKAVLWALAVLVLSASATWCARGATLVVVSLADTAPVPPPDVNTLTLLQAISQAAPGNIITFAVDAQLLWMGF